MSFLEITLDFLFPKSCILCGKINEEYLCKNCSKRIEKYSEFKYLNKEVLISDKKFFDRIFYCYKYKGLIRKCLLDYKFNNKSYYCNFFAKMLLNCKKTYRLFNIYDIIIPVPMDKLKRLQRGYNQTELITDLITKNADITNGKYIVKKVKKTKTQSTLNSLERVNNVKKAFKVFGKSEIVNKRVILFDDIFTTGSTVNEISKVLKENGAKEILVLVLAKD